jgi:FkbM family methyltransferase
MTMKKTLKKILPSKFLAVIINIYLKILPYKLVGFFLNIKMRNIKMEKFLIKFPKTSNKNTGKYFFNVYENNERSLIKKYLNSNSKVLELGGCVGVVSNVINDILNNKSNHIVLEANLDLIPFLLYNKEINKAQFQILNVVLSQKKESAFYISENILSSSNSYDPFSDKKIVKCLSFEQIQSKYSISFDTLIMDIEGAEYDVLMEINYDKLKLIIVEFHPNIIGNIKILELKKILEDNSFILKESLANVDVWEKN